MNTDKKILSANLIIGLRVVEHQPLHVHTLELKEDPEYKVSGDEVKYKDINVTPASDERIKQTLRTIGIIIEDKETIKKVSVKFWKQLTSIEGERLAFHHNTGIFYEILQT